MDVSHFGEAKKLALQLAQDRPQEIVAILPIQGIDFIAGPYIAQNTAHVTAPLKYQKSKRSNNKTIEQQGFAVWIWIFYFFLS